MRRNETRRDKARRNETSKGALRELLKATRRAIRQAERGSGGATICLRWCPGRTGVPGNEAADEEASRTASGFTHPPHLIPRFLTNYCPAINPSTRRQAMKAENRKLAEAHWASTDAGESRYPGISPRGTSSPIPETSPDPRLPCYSDSRPDTSSYGNIFTTSNLSTLPDGNTADENTKRPRISCSDAHDTRTRDTST
ncbi:hypothetical protein RSOL_175620, partial [Rhizoctonia solani AG-3 Rhs1AP]